MDIPKIEERFGDHENRITTLERNFQSLEGKVQNIETGVSRVENTVLKESKVQQDLTNKLIDHHFNFKTTKTMSRKEIWVAALGGGGIVGAITAITTLF
jgi:predicted  nucleic acid-binding Zn-ribbon protein